MGISLASAAGTSLAYSARLHAAEAENGAGPPTLGFRGGRLLALCGVFSGLRSPE